MRTIVEEIIDRSSCWSYFDGGSQGTPAMGRARGILFFTDSHWIELSTGIGFSANNRAEMTT